MNKYLMNHRFLGVVFVGMLVLGVWLVNAVFTQKFVSFDRVTLDTSTVGLQLPEKADVKVRGRDRRPGDQDGVQGPGRRPRARHQARADRLDPGQRERRDPAQDPLRREVRRAHHPQGPRVRVAEGGRQDQAGQAPDRGGAGPERPLPAAAHGPAGGAELHAQRPRQRPRRARQQDRRGPGDPRRLPEEDEPADPGAHRRHQAARHGRRHLCRRHAGPRGDPAQHHEDGQHLALEGAEAERLPQGPHRVLRHDHVVPQRQRQQHHSAGSARRADPRPAEALLRHLPVPARGDREAGAAPG